MEELKVIVEKIRKIENEISLARAMVQVEAGEISVYVAMPIDYASENSIIEKIGNVISKHLCNVEYKYSYTTVEHRVICYRVCL